MDRISLCEIGLSAISLPIGVDPPAEELGVIEATRNLYANRGFSVPWVCYLAVRGSKCVGTCGFTGPPKDQQVEIAYFTFPENEGEGVATKMATLLVEIALNAGMEGLQIVAHTLPTKNASTCILERVGFKCDGEIEHEEDGKVWRWVRAVNSALGIRS